MPTLETHNGYPLWHYIPSLPAAIVFAALFGCLTVAHAWKICRYRTWFCLPFVVGGVFEVIGYVGRAVAYDSTGELLPYIIQSIFLLIAPILFAASLYMTLGRIIRSVHGEHCSLIPARWLTRIFVFGDVFSFLIQSSGAGLRVRASNGDGNSNPNLGSNIIVGGLIFQIVVFAIYVLAAVWFHVKFSKHDQSKRAGLVSWRSGLWMVYMTSAFIMVRNIVRVAEYAMGNEGYLLNHEWNVYVFDGALMLFTMTWFYLKYPNQFAVTSASHNSPDVELASPEDRDTKHSRR
ncbi:Protein RTA1 [Paramyrothecium foliicola]|nr:Protein RTA1 [Paramyrothecium foliicola]